jgi:hypothetical protein
LIRDALLLSPQTFEKSLIKTLCNGVITTLFKKGLTANLLRKGLIENSGINFKRLIPKPYRRDQPAQRLRYNSCGQWNELERNKLKGHVICLWFSAFSAFFAFVSPRLNFCTLGSLEFWIM